MLTAVWAWLLFSELLSAAQITGMALVLAGVGWLSIGGIVAGRSSPSEDAKGLKGEVPRRQPEPVPGGEPPPIAKRYGIADPEGEDTMVLVWATVEVAAEAFSRLRGTRTWERDVYGRAVELTAACFVVYRIRGQAWTVVRDRNLSRSRLALAVSTDDARALSEKLDADAIYFAHSDTAGVLSYAYYRAGRLVEAFHSGEGFPADREGYDLYDPRAELAFRSVRREVPGRDKLEDRYGFAGDFLESRAALAPPGDLTFGRPSGRPVELAMGWLAEEDCERMDFIA